MELFVVLNIYFTIGNPDMKLISVLENTKEHVQKVNRSKTEFLSSMSYEIRTPLNAISGVMEKYL